MYHYKSVTYSNPLAQPSTMLTVYLDSSILHSHSQAFFVRLTWRISLLPQFLHHVVHYINIIKQTSFNIIKHFQNSQHYESLICIVNITLLHSLRYFGVSSSLVRRLSHQQSVPNTCDLARFFQHFLWLRISARDDRPWMMMDAQIIPSGNLT